MQCCGRNVVEKRDRLKPIKFNKTNTNDFDLNKELAVASDSVYKYRAARRTWSVTIATIAVHLICYFSQLYFSTLKPASV